MAPRGTLTRTAAFLVAALSLASAAPAAAQDKTSNAPVATSTHNAFYVVVDSQSDKAAQAMVPIAVAEELNKCFELAAASTDPHHCDPVTKARGVWAIPETSWSASDLLAQCARDPSALGGVLLTVYHGYASHFYLLWQSETSTFAVFASVISCSGAASGTAMPSIVAIVSETDGATHTPWIVRRSQVSIPLITLAGLGAVFSKGNTNTVQTQVKGNTTTTTTGSSGTSLSFSVIAGALFSQASSRDIPGYSDPLRIRDGAVHIGDDFIGAMGVDCRTPGKDVKESALCDALGFATQ